MKQGFAEKKKKRIEVETNVFASQFGSEGSVYCFDENEELDQTTSKLNKELDQARRHPWRRG